ncbi:MAG: hypothetical protein IJ693_10860 [Bacteroidaceae bacterium]|nr:hypothetical protein [Bacteroidaceae bacterium]
MSLLKNIALRAGLEGLERFSLSHGTLACIHLSRSPASSSVAHLYLPRSFTCIFLDRSLVVSLFCHSSSPCSVTRRLPVLSLVISSGNPSPLSGY